MSFLFINKPPGWTSHDVVAYIRNKIQKAQPGTVGPGRARIRVGHAGTLDPFATGLLIIGVGRDATKRLDQFKQLSKTYTAVIRLGATSDTDDVTGVITPTRSSWPEADIPSIKQIQQVLEHFRGKQQQIPPMFSAKKIGGKKLYQLARRGVTIERKPSAIEIYSITVLDYHWPHLAIEVHCSPGTYIRSLARDIGEMLGPGAYCEQLTRSAIGDHTVVEATALEDIDSDTIGNSTIAWFDQA